MVWALYLLNHQIKAIQNILPRTCLLLTHAVLMILIVVFALIFYIAQFSYYGHNCDTIETETEVCRKAGDWLVGSNAAYTLDDALCYALILYMTYKFLI